jgi:SAM-dependent methyltransferase
VTSSVLELACGKGGDYFKISSTLAADAGMIHHHDNGGGHGDTAMALDYVGVDISLGGLKEFVQRLEENATKRNNQSKFKRGTTTAAAARYRQSQRLACVNLGTDQLTTSNTTTGTTNNINFEVWDSRRHEEGGGGGGGWTRGVAFQPTQRFDFASMQFALHYMFQDPDRLRTFFESWSRYLRTGRYFVATTMDIDVVRRHALDLQDDSFDIILRDEIGRPSCTMSLDPHTREALRNDLNITTATTKTHKQQRQKPQNARMVYLLGYVTSSYSQSTIQKVKLTIWWKHPNGSSPWMF